VSTPEQAGSVATYADGVIVGSSLVDLVAKSDHFDSALSRLRSFLSETVKAVEAGRP
jgi:tryptophan synthase alpha subunit